MQAKRIVQAGWIFFALLINNAIVDHLYGSDVSENQAKLNGGYFLLYRLCDEEAQLPMLTDIKHTPPDLADYVIRISKVAKDSSAALEKMRDNDRAIRFDQNPLPSIEREVRESISDAKQHQLLFGTKDSTFVHALLISQIEASNYALNLAKVLSGQENNSSRGKILAHIQAKWQAVLDEAYRRLKAD